MRTSLAVAIAILLLLLMEMDGAVAQNYAWCAEAIKGGGQNCGFVSWEQCMATVSGTAGIASKIRCIARNLKAPCRPASGAGDEDARVAHADVTCPRARRAGAAPDADGWRARAELPLVRAV